MWPYDQHDDEFHNDVLHKLTSLDSEISMFSDPSDYRYECYKNTYPGDKREPFTSKDDMLNNADKYVERIDDLGRIYSIRIVK